jgi:transcriptional regulator, XRE family
LWYGIVFLYHIERTKIMAYTKIRDLREDADLTQAQMAKVLNCSQQAYSNYELGQRDIPTDILIALAEFHKTNVDYILGLTKTKKYYKEL